MAEITYKGTTYRIGDGQGTPLELVQSNIAPQALPKSWMPSPHPGRMANPSYERWYISTTGLRVCMTAAIEGDHKRWLHISVSHRGGRLPTWTEMCQIKAVFCGEARTSYQVHPSSAKHVSIHDKCLHLWTCLDGPVTPDFTRGGDTI